MGKRAVILIVSALAVMAWLEITAACGLWILASVHGVEWERLPDRELEPVQRFVLELLLADEHGYLEHDAELGWTVRPGGRSDLYSANAAGLRAEREYSARPAPGVLRIAAFGDSFTHGDDVANAETWQSRLEQLDPALEVLNFGVPAFGPGQAYLRYLREGVAPAPHVVFIGLLSENVYRTVNVFRPFYRPPTGVPLAKPRFRLANGALELLPNPMPALEDYRVLLDAPEATLRRLGEHDYYYRREQRRLPLDSLRSVRLLSVLQTRFWTEPISEGGIYASGSEALRLTRAIVAAFAEAVAGASAVPLVLLYPTATDLRQAQAGQPTRYASLLAALRDDGRDVVDGLAILRARAADAPGDPLIRLHLTPQAQRLLAHGLYEALESLKSTGALPAH